MQEHESKSTVLIVADDGCTSHCRYYAAPPVLAAHMAHAHFAQMGEIFSFTNGTLDCVCHRIDYFGNNDHKCQVCLK